MLIILRGLNDWVLKKVKSKQLKYRRQVMLNRYKQCRKPRITGRSNVINVPYAKLVIYQCRMSVVNAYNPRGH